MEFYLQTGHGDSDLSYSGTHDDPFQGLCQGNGAAPGLWLCTCSVLVAILCANGHMVTFETAITGVILLLAVLIFVDDTDLLCHTLCSSPDAQSIIPLLQEAIDLWQGTLQATGGDLKLVKCLVQIVGFCWQSGRPLYS
eukprot:2026769-Ditylum_brightwellii.AAC.1